MIRRAAIRDVTGLARIINDCAEYGLMLHRSMEFLYERVRDFHVAVAEDAQGEHVVGVCGLGVVWANLAEVYALAVAPDQRGRGLGRMLVEAVIQDAHELGVRRLMSLTYEQRFFEKLGFQVIDRQTLPMKVWSECARCPKNHACDEIAMVRLLDVPEIQVPRPPVEPGRYEVPVMLGIKGVRRPVVAVAKPEA
jgi:amino-acid N-acetyltransferase